MAQKYVYPQICSFICWVLGLGVGGGVGYGLITVMGQDLAKSGVIALAATLVVGLVLRRLLCRRQVGAEEDWVDRITPAQTAGAAAVTGAAMLEPELQAHLDEDYVEEEEVYAADEPAAPPFRAREPAPEFVPEQVAEAAPDPVFEQELADALADTPSEPVAEPTPEPEPEPQPEPEPEAVTAADIIAQPALEPVDEPELTINVPEEVEDGDDLTMIEGVDDDMAVELYALGIDSIEQIATMGPGQINLLAEQIPGVEGASVVRQWKRNARGLLDAQTGT